MTQKIPAVPETTAALMPKTHSVALSAGTFTLRPLTIRQISALTRLLEGITLPDGMQCGMLTVIAARLGSKLPDALAVLLSNGEPGPEFTARCADLTFEDVALLADALAEVNDFVKLRATFQAAVAKAFRKDRTV